MPRPLVAALCIATLAAADPGAPPAKVRLLAVGNSFSNNALHYLGDIAKAAGCELERTHLMIGGSPLQLHWEKAEAALKDPADPKGQYGEKGVLGSLPSNLDKGPWDAVTIQQYSMLSHDPKTYRPFADKLVELIRQKAPTATVYIHETWAYRRDDPRFGAGKDFADAEEMYRKVSAAYHGVADDLHLTLIPVGEAFHLVAGDAAWAWKPDAAWDAKTAEKPSLPDQAHSLNVGWSWTTDKDGKPALRFDGHHANMNGEYLGGCVWFEVLFHRSPVGNAFRPKGMPDDVAAYLQAVAHHAVEAAAPAPAHAP